MPEEVVKKDERDCFWEVGSNGKKKMDGVDNYHNKSCWLLFNYVHDDLIKNKN